MIRMLRLNPIVLISCFSCLLLQAALVAGAGHDPPPNRPTQLDDIERDTLNSERQVFKKEAIAQQQQQQQQGASSSQSNNHYSLQIQHHPGSTAAAHSSVKYVTPLPAPTQITYPAKDHHVAPQHYFHQQPQQQQHQPVQQLQYQPHQLHQHQLPHQPVPQVHEDHSTYTVPSRQSLLQPVIGGGAPTSPYLTPQPQYVYVQARPQQLAAVTSPGQGLPQSLLHILPQNSQAYIMIPTPAYYHQQQQQQQQQPPPHLVPSSGAPLAAPTQAPHSAQQLAAYANDPDNHIETYSHGETGAQSPSAPAPPPSLPSLPPQVPQATTPTPDIVYAPSASTPVPPHRHQSPSSEFSIVKSVEQPIYYSHDLPSPAYSNKDFPQHSFVPAPYHHQRPTHLQPYPSIVPGSSPLHYPQHLVPAPSPLYPSLSHPNNGILNYFGVQQRPPTSLLDSYVPSGLQVHKGPPVFVPKVQHRPVPPPAPPVSFYQPGYPFLTGPAAPHHHHHQPHHAFPVNHLHTTVLQPAASATTLTGHHAHQVLPAYNTIAYSVPLAFTKTSAQYKRSPALFSVAGFVPRLPLAMATTKLQPAAKLP